MGRKNDPIWRERFSAFLKLLQSVFLLDLGSFRMQYHVSGTTTSYWASGRNLPCLENFNSLHHFIEESIASTSTPQTVVERVSIDFYEFAGTEGYEWLCSARLNAKEYVTSALNYYFFLARGEMPEALNRSAVITPTGKTRAVLFDFSGTLVTGFYTDSTWYAIWNSLGLDAGRFNSLMQHYNSDITSRKQFYEKLCDTFSQQHLNKEAVAKIGSSLTRLKGIPETFKELHDRGIRIHIVSQSDRTLIRAALHDALPIIDEIQSNELRYDDDGFVAGITETKFDFKGKALYVQRVADELNVSPRDIVFVGNSANDEYVAASGAKMICINARETKPTGNDSVWDVSLAPCQDLRNVLDYIDS